MKYISFAIPCYNSEAYMEKAINSILPGGEDVEIIVVNDGSKDSTQEIAERYQEKYPTIVKAVKKENGGHGTQSTVVLLTPRENISKSWTVMTGWTRNPCTKSLTLSKDSSMQIPR